MNPMRLRLLPIFLLAVPLSAQDKGLLPVAERLRAQNALFDEQYESDLREFPERATSFGDYRYNNQLSERSIAATERREKTDQAFLARLEAISTAGFSDQDQLSHNLLVRGSNSASRISNS